MVDLDKDESDVTRMATVKSLRADRGLKLEMSVF